MSIILPYEKGISYKGGAFIKPNGVIIPAYGKHEKIAKNYCEGMTPTEEDERLFIYPKLPLFEESQLTKSQRISYQLWLEKKEMDASFWADFLVFCLGFDKVEFVSKETITTSSHQPHIRFYNYYLMDWRIDVLPNEFYNPDTDHFETTRFLPYLDDYADMEAARELEDLKQKVKVKERPLFFK